MEYCYLIQFNPTKQWYIGSRTSKDADPAEFWNENHKHPYFTSSKIVKNLILTCGKDSFSVLEIKEFPEGGALDYESRILENIDFKSSPMWLNRSCNCNRNPANVKGLHWVTDGKIEFYLKKNVEIPENLTYGRTRKTQKKSLKKYRYMFHSELDIDTRVEESKCDYYLALGYQFGQRHTTHMKWWNNGIINIYTKDILNEKLWSRGRILSNSQMITIKDPNGQIFNSLQEYRKFIKESINLDITMGSIARAVLSGKTIKISKSCYTKRCILLKHYNIDINCIGKTWLEIGFIFSKNL